MSEQLETVVDNKHSEEKTKEQILNQKFSIEGYNVAIFYTKKTLEDRYITITITNEETGDKEDLEKIRMVSDQEVKEEQKQERIKMESDEEIVIETKDIDEYKYEEPYPDSGIDVLDVTHALEAVDLYLYDKRHQTIDHNLSKLALAA